ALLRASGPRVAVGVGPYGGSARVLAPPSHEPPSAAALVAAADSAGIDPDASDLAGALALAAPLCPETTQPAVLLFSDGQETRGSALAEASLEEPHVPVYPVTLAEADFPRAVIRRVLAPTRAPEHVMAPLGAVGASPTPPPTHP